MLGGIGAKLSALTANKWALAGVAGVAGLGAVTLARTRREHGSAPATESTGEAVASSAGGQGAFPNTYQTDLAAALGDLDGRYAEELAGFQKSVTANAASIAALSKSQAATAKKVAAITPKPAAKKAAAPAKKAAAAAKKAAPKPAAKAAAKRRAPVRTTKTQSIKVTAPKRKPYPRPKRPAKAPASSKSGLYKRLPAR